jgi:hypothetical protein
MQQIGMFPLSDLELKQKAKDLAAKIHELVRLERDKDASNKAFTEDLRRCRRDMLALAKVIEEGQEQREASDEEAPWQETLDKAHEIAGRARRRRDRTGEMADNGE